jgi:AcrR family transcriptional regulator
MAKSMKKDAILDHENAERILEEGWKLFQQKGYRGVTVDELCRRCGLTKPTLYYYFKDKENLFVQVLQYRLEGFHKVVEQPGTLAERLERFATSIFGNFQSEYSILLRDREHIKLHENLEHIRDAFHREMFGPLIALMQSGIDRGELAGDNPEMLALIFLGVVNNLIGKAAEMGMENFVLAQQATGYFLNGVRKTSPA